MYYRLKQGGKSYRWYPQYKRGESGEWNNFVGAYAGWRAFETVEEAEEFLEKRNPKFRQYYEGTKSARPLPQKG